MSKGWVDFLAVFQILVRGFGDCIAIPQAFENLDVKCVRSARCDDLPLDGVVLLQDKNSDAAIAPHSGLGDCQGVFRYLSENECVHVRTRDQLTQRLSTVHSTSPTCRVPSVMTSVG